jgi:hypothetical protein
MASIASATNTRNAKEQSFDVVDKALHRRRLGLSIGKHLEKSAIVADDAEALAVADMLQEGARLENIWHGEDLHNADGEAFEGYGSLNVPSSRLAPEYMATSSRRARRRVKDALDRCKPAQGENLRMVTLTMPDIDAGFELTMAVFDHARALLRKRQWFKKVFRGGVFGEEFTYQDHFHVHCHVMAWSKWVVWKQLGEEWTSCLIASAAKHDVEMNFATSHGRAVVDVRLVTSKRRGKGTVSKDDAVQEVAKYITKGSTFAELPPAQLVEVERVLHRRRMIETFGEANKRKGKTEVTGEASSTDEQRTYLDTQDIVDGADTLAKTKKPRLESLRVVGARMIREGNRLLWLDMLRHIYAERREWRKAQLSKRYPVATFRTLSGEVWYGAGVIQRGTLSDRMKGFHPPLSAGIPATKPAVALSLA